MIDGRTMERNEIRNHYELISPFYWLLWGAHIHHGLWDADESPRQAQRQLIEHLAREASIERGSRVLDVGCGIGGSSIFLAKELECDVTGLTLSGVQRLWASTTSRLKGASRHTRFLRQNAEAAELPDEQFDVIWIIECSEHFFDKPAFFKRASRWLKPGGRFAVCAWLAGEPPYDEQALQQLHTVCDAFLCPSLGTAEDYVGWMEAAGLQRESVVDVTPRITRTWEICRQRAQRTGMPWLARLFGRNACEFIDHFDTILNAYRSGAMQYASIVARRSNEA